MKFKTYPPTGEESTVYFILEECEDGSINLTAVNTDGTHRGGGTVLKIQQDGTILRALHIGNLGLQKDLEGRVKLAGENNE